MSTDLGNQRVRFYKIKIGSIRHLLPAQKAPITKAVTLYFMVLMPISAAISSSRIEMQARPCADFIKLDIPSTVAAQDKHPGPVNKLGDTI